MSTFHLGPRPGHLSHLAGRDAAHGGSPRSSALTASSAAGVHHATAPEGPRVTLRIRLPDRTITAEIASKSLRKAQTAIREAGPHRAAQGHRKPHDPNQGKQRWGVFDLSTQRGPLSPLRAQVRTAYRRYVFDGRTTLWPTECSRLD
jgi:hypothetical protein